MSNFISFKIEHYFECIEPGIQLLYLMYNMTHLVFTEDKTRLNVNVEVYVT